MAGKWYRWSAGAKAAACMHNSEITRFRKAGWRVSGINRARESFPVYADCGDAGTGYTFRCYDEGHLAAWRMKYTITKNGASYPVDYDYVVVRSGDMFDGHSKFDWRAVVAFNLFGGPLFDAGSLVETVLERT
jgi:hypothetical protein